MDVGDSLIIDFNRVCGISCVQGAIKSICAGLQKLAEKVGKEKNVDAIRLPPAIISDYIEVCLNYTPYVVGHM